MTDPQGEREEGFSLVKALYEQALREHRERLEELLDPQVIYVTDLVYCPLKRGFRQRFPELAFSFKPPQVTGTLIHRGLRETLEEAGFELEKPVEASIRIGDNLYRVKGRVDAYREDLIIEIKTGRAGQQLPHEHHVLQVKLYLDLTGVGRGMIVYITPDRLVEYTVKPERGLLEKMLQEHLEEARAPLWDWECRLCTFADYCSRRTA